MSSILPPLDCTLSLDEIIDFHISCNNRGAAFSFADAQGSITDISHFEFARAAHRVAHILRPQRLGPEGQVLAIIALTDSLIYQTLVAGCIKAGIVPFPISNRNSSAAVVHLLDTTKSHRLLVTKASLGPLTDAISADLATLSVPYDLSVEEIPLLGQIYPYLGHEKLSHEFVPYPSPTTRTPLDTVAMYLHSSGSTGFPKSIPETHRTLLHYAAMDAIFESRELAPRQAVGALPSFHALAMVEQFIFPVLAGGTACIYPPTSLSTPMEYRIPIVPTAENAIDNARRANANGIVAVPAMILEWAAAEEHVEYLKTLKLLTYSGGPLSERVGDKLVREGVNLVPMYGATEFGAPSIVKRHQEEIDAGEWAWLRFSDRVHVRWMPQGDGTFECQFLTTPETHQVAIENLPDTKGYSTKDLFERHPTKPDLFKIVGRLDDVLIMANGEKTVPGPMEDVMMSSPYIRGAIMFGRERNQIGVLIEPNPQQKVDPSDEKQLAEFRNLIWPVIQEANENAPSFARIYKEMILLTQPSKPMVRAPKGTVIKKATLALYNAEIDALYNTIEASNSAGSDVEPPSSWTQKDLEPWLMKHASQLAEHPIRVGDDLFDQGFDSLNATFLRHRIVGALKTSDHKGVATKISQNIAYSHPSIQDLASAIVRLVRGGDAASSESDSIDDHKAAVEAMISKYSEGFDVAPSATTPRSSDAAVVLLTGTTGALGSHVLAMLLDSAAVQRVYAFNRRGRTPIFERQHDAFVDRGLDTSLLSSGKLVYLEGDTAKSDLSLPADLWTELRETVTVIIHNAWMLDFNKKLSSFESHIKGTRNLIDLARSSPHAIRFLFTSSIASAQGWDQSLGLFPEELQLDASVAVGNGYGEGKYASERILAASGLEATSFRIGQVSGATSSGAWSTTDWVPAIVKSSLALGAFPSDPASLVAWLPAEAVSGAIVDAALTTTTPPFAINLVHPRPIPWDLVMSSMADSVKVPLKPFAEWVQDIRDRLPNATAEDLENIPGLKLLDFLAAAEAGRANTEFSTTKAQELSNSMKLLEPLNVNDARRWMGYWQGKNFIQ
ncbi:putative aminoadipate reductase [Roridomyces roridus]|uniref:Aminoadipate reductase n=1 Tax=Roridomyces roridus TaxID=1738132 RepID=A0AAD7AY80_9AGAR|nr:putative aminoadipate reductase [Roridomyces roridus]